MTGSRIDSKLYVVTGASSGIGEAIARELHQRGARLFLVARREDRLHALAEELNGNRPHSTEYFLCDLSSDDGVTTLKARLQDQDVYGLVNNAGFGSYGEFRELHCEREIAMIRLNVEAPLQLTHAVVDKMVKRGEGVVVNIASIAGFQPLPYMSTYAATKAALLSHSLSLSYELKPHGVQVLAVCPGPVPTEFGRVAGVPGEFGSLPSDSADSIALSIIKAIVARRSTVVVPGVTGKILRSIVRFFPQTFVLSLIGRLMKPAFRLN
ncbi:MAG: SDR family oxidoreductase [Bdellovibrionales bacterium]|nr:SDR family oxidoreductase [Bdellovibrionales bacterium]